MLLVSLLNFLNLFIGIYLFFISIGSFITKDLIRDSANSSKKQKDEKITDSDVYTVSCLMFCLGAFFIHSFIQIEFLTFPLI